MKGEGRLGAYLKWLQTDRFYPSNFVFSTLRIRGIVLIVLSSYCSITVSQTGMEEIRQLRVIDASIAEISSKLNFCAEYAYEFGFTNEFSVNIDKELFSTQSHVERANGELLVGPDAFRYKYNLLTPFKVIDGTSGEISAEYALGDSFFLQYIPKQVPLSGNVVAETIRLNAQVRSADNPVRIPPLLFGMRHCIWNRQGFADGFLFGKYTELGSAFFDLKREPFPGVEGDVLVVTGRVGAQPEPFEVTWIIDDNDVYPVLLEYRSLGLVTRYSDIKKLKSGVRIPMESISVSRSFGDTNDKFSLKRWRFTNFEERIPSPGEFAIRFSKDVRALGLEIPKDATSLNILDVEKGEVKNTQFAISAEFEKRRSTELDDDFSGSVIPPDYYLGQYFLSLVLGLIAFGALVWMLRSMVVNHRKNQHLP